MVKGKVSIQMNNYLLPYDYQYQGLISVLGSCLLDINARKTLFFFKGAF